MGSGPATHLASLNNAYSLLLMSPYTSIKDISKSLFGKLSFLVTPLVYERFRNIDAIKGARCPVFFLHGMKDKLIPHTQTLELNNHCPSISFLHMPPEMDHNVFDFENDLIEPFKQFLKKIDDGIAAEKKRGGGAKGQAGPLIKIDDSKVVYGGKEKDKKKQEHEDDNNDGSDDNNQSSSSEDEEHKKFDLPNSGEKFEICFDKTLFEPPAIIKATYNRLETMAKSQAQIKAAQSRGRW